MTSPPPTASSTLRHLAPVYTGQFFVLITNSIAFTTIAARTVAGGFDSSTIGLAGSAYYAGLFGIYLSGPTLVLRVSLRTLALASTVLTAIGLAALLASHPVAWFFARFAMGIGTALIYVSVENWINGTVSREVRGRAIAFYVCAFLGSYVTGQATLLLLPATANTALIVAAVGLLISAAAFWTAKPPAAAVAAGRTVVRSAAIVRHAPHAVLAAFVAGIAASTFFAFGPIYALHLGLAIDRVAFFMIVVILGAGTTQAVLGVISDRTDRNAILAIMCVVGVTASLVLLSVSTFGWIAALGSIAWGASAITLYAPAAALAYDAPHGASVRDVARVILVANGIGGLLGPSAAALIDAGASGRSPFLLTLWSFVPLAGLLLWRRLSQRA